MTYDHLLLMSTMHCEEGTESFCSAKIGTFSNIAARIKKKMRINRQENKNKNNKTNPSSSSTAAAAAEDVPISTAAILISGSRKIERNSNKNFLLKFPLSFPRKAGAAYKSQPGVTNLHHACFQARPPSVLMSIMRSEKERSADTPDFLGRLPLHILTIRICEGKMPLTDSCLVVVHLLSAEYLQGIFAKDDFGDTPLDIVHDAKLSLRERGKRKDQDAYQRHKRNLDVLSIHLRRIGIYRYLQQKNAWEKRDDLFNDEFHNSDISSLAVQATSERSVTSSSSVGTCANTDAGTDYSA